MIDKYNDCIYENNNTTPSITNTNVSIELATFKQTQFDSNSMQKLELSMKELIIGSK